MLRFFPLLLLLLAACTPKSPTSSTSGEAITFTTDSLTRKAGICSSDTAACFTIELSYPKVASGPAAFAQPFDSLVLAFLKNAFIMEPDSQSAAQPLDTLLRALLASYETELAEAGSTWMAWEMELNGEVIHQSPQTVSLSFTQYSYLGGAHPNGYEALFSLDTQTGKVLAWTDLVGDTLAAKPVIEAAFRRAREIGPDDNLEEAGFWFENNTFTLPRQAAITPEGLRIVFNPYEITAYAGGATDFVVPLDSIPGLLRR